MPFVQSMLVIAQEGLNNLPVTAETGSSMPSWLPFVQDIAYLVAAILFILGIKKLSSPRTARQGNRVAATGMLVAIIATVYFENWVSIYWIFGAMLIGSAIGYWLAATVKMTGMPELVGLFNGFGGLASLLVATSEFAKTYVNNNWEAMTFDRGFALGLGVLIGSITLTGSTIAFLKLRGSLPGRPVQWPGPCLRHQTCVCVGEGLGT